MTTVVEREQPERAPDMTLEEWLVGLATDPHHGYLLIALDYGIATFASTSKVRSRMVYGRNLLPG